MGEEPEFIFLQFLNGSGLAAHPANDDYRGSRHSPTLGAQDCTVYTGFTRCIFLNATAGFGAFSLHPLPLPVGFFPRGLSQVRR
jgi:hypothetical protein